MSIDNSTMGDDRCTVPCESKSEISSMDLVRRPKEDEGMIRAAEQDADSVGVQKTMEGLNMGVEDLNIDSGWLPSC